ncbi:GntR family transcriptional regulator [Mycetocola sp.]|uniref:GntR family transcriptional regulator n=1 Tax=Mycetocola sp. TaxID=1871042 RepID=UPI003989A202
MTDTPIEEAKHVAIANHLRRAIESRQFPIGSEIPSESSLAKQFEASRGTIRQALSTLKSEGLIQTSKGRRPVVHARPLEQSIDDFFSFSSWIKAQGRSPGQRTIEISRRRRESPEPELPLGYPNGEYLVYLTRLRLIDDQPTMVERSVFHNSVGQSLLQFDTDSGSIYEYLITRGADLDEGTHLVDAVPANALDAELLEVEVGTPILRVRRNTTSAAGFVLEYSEDRYRPDHANIRIRNTRAEAAALISASRNTTTSTL